MLNDFQMKRLIFGFKARDALNATIKFCVFQHSVQRSIHFLGYSICKFILSRIEMG